MLSFQIATADEDRLTARLNELSHSGAKEEFPGEAESIADELTDRAFDDDSFDFEDDFEDEDDTSGW